MSDDGVVQVFDTTLRDGEQMPQLAFTVSDKLKIARQLDALGVAVIEAGFPVNSAQEAEAVRLIAAEVFCPVCGIARAVRADLDAVIRTGAAMVDVFCSTSDIQMEQSTFKTRPQVVEASVQAVKHVKDAGLECMFTPMDATRTDPDFLVEVCGAAATAGADWIGLTDTVGVGTPETVAGMVQRVVAAVPTPVSIHCHDDFGLATANTLAAVAAGAGMFQACVNGLGERAGNAALEEVAVALKCLAGVECGLDFSRLYSTSRLVERLSGVAVPGNKPVVGANAFTHESGIHAAGVMRDGKTFEPGLLTPDLVGHRRRLVVGKHTGRHGIAQALAEAGLEPGDEELTEIVERVRAVVAKGKPLINADLFAIAETVMQRVPAGLRAIVLDQLMVTTGNRITPTASVQAKVHGVDRVESHVGVGPVDAAFKAVQRMLGENHGLEIADYHVDTVTGGSHATVRVSVTVEDGKGRRQSAYAAHEDIVLASVDALITAINHLLRLTNGQDRPAAVKTGSQTLFDKIWQAHLVDQPPDGHPLLYADRLFLHEVTSPQAFEGLRRAERKVRRPDLAFAVMDHVTPTDPGRKRPLADPVAEAQLAALERGCRDFGLTLFDMDDPRQGVIHVTMPELGLVLPGQTAFCGDSHTSTLGAFGALAFGVGTSEVEHVLATQCLRQRRPGTLGVFIDGQLPPGVFAKDLILAVIARLGFGGGTGHVIEFRGPVIDGLDMEGRMTLCNMSVECGAKAGLIAPDETTFAYLSEKPWAPRGADWDQALDHWRTLAGDPDATFDRELRLDAASLEPQVTWGTNPAQSTPLSGVVPDPDSLDDPDAARAALEYMDLRPGQALSDVAVDWVFIGSCTNGRLSDLRAAASVIDGRRVAPGVRALVVPGSGRVKAQAEAEGLDKIFTAAGFEWRLPGCSLCLGMNPDTLPPGARSASTTNRNFRGRQGRGSRVHLCSPATAAATALTGRLTDARHLG